MWALQLLTYLAVLVFAVGVIAKVVKYARAPMHVRWELYPVPHEKGKEAYGGSYLEEPDWWTKPRERDKLGEIKAMLAEMLLIKALWHHNRGQWVVSFPFHAGLYGLIGFVALLLIGAVAEVAGFAVAADAPVGLFAVLHYATVVVGLVALLAATCGAAGLLYRRVMDEDLRRYSTPADYLNLVFLLAVFGSVWIAWGADDLTFALLRDFVRGAITFSPAAVPATVVAEVALVALFMIYLPFTHMTHFVAKYFTWHNVRWDDAPNLKGGDVGARIAANLARPVSWSAPHIPRGKTWAEVATEEDK